MLLRNVNPTITYFHFVIKSKFPMLLNVIRKGNLRFIVPLHLQKTYSISLRRGNHIVPIDVPKFKTMK
jgi:hypothetical protein